MTNLRVFALKLLKVRVVLHVGLDFRVLGYPLHFGRIGDGGGLRFRNVPVRANRQKKTH